MLSRENLHGVGQPTEQAGRDAELNRTIQILPVDPNRSFRADFILRFERQLFDFYLGKFPDELRGAISQVEAL